MIALFIAYFVVGIAIIIIFYITSLIFISHEKVKDFKEKLCLIVPLYCILLWAIYYIFAGWFFLTPNYDFFNYYYCGKRVLKRPYDLYEDDFEYGYRYGYKYLPVFAILIGIPLSLFPTIEMAYYTFYIINIFLGLIFTWLFNILLKLLNVNEAFHRFLFLLVISNGWIVLQLYANNQIKYFVGILIMIIILREIKYEKYQIKKDFKYYFINLNVFVFIIGLAQYFIFLLIIYLFHDISKNDLFKWENIKKYITIIISFLLQNLLFLIYPRLIFDFYEIYLKEQRRNDVKLKHFYLEYIDDYVITLPSIYKFYISLILNIILYSVVLILTIYKRISLIEKFGYFCLAFLYLNYIAYRILLNLIPFVCVLLIPYLNQKKRGFEFIKENFTILLCLISISGIFFTPHKEAFSYPFIEGIYIGYLIFMISFGVSFLVLIFKNKKHIRNDTLT